MVAARAQVARAPPVQRTTECVRLGAIGEEGAGTTPSDDVTTGGSTRRLIESVPTKMHKVTASTAKWPRNAPEQPATAMGATATRYQGVNFIRDCLHMQVITKERPATCVLRYDIPGAHTKFLPSS